MNTLPNVEAIRDIFHAVEHRDPDAFARRCVPDLELHWPASLPYGGIARGLEPRDSGWQDVWNPLQPTEAERRMDPRVVAATDTEVVVLWRQRGVSPTGERIDQPVLGLYVLRESRLARGQMFYFDTYELCSFLSRARSTSPAADRR